MQTSMDRRDFLKGAALSAGTAAFAGTASALAGEAAAPQLPEGFSLEDFQESSVEIEPITQFAAQKTYDVVVVGAGTSGVPAALTALEEGASVALLQRDATATAQGTMDCGIILSESSQMGVLGFVEEYTRQCIYRTNRELVKTYTYHAGESIMWLAKMGEMVGNPADVMTATTKTYYDGEPCFIATNTFGVKPRSNQDLCIALTDWAVTQGLDVFYETVGVQLVKEDGRVTAVIGKNDDGEYIKFNATKAVILATGDYQNNNSLVRKWSPDIQRFARKQYGKTGDGILMSALAGGHVVNVAHCRQMHDNDSGMMRDEPFLAVDDSGNRFMNEHRPMHYWAAALVDIDQPGDPGKFCHIFDDNYIETATAWGGKPAAKAAMLNYVPGAVENPQGVYTALIDTHFADTLEELAEQLGIPADNLIASVERYNELCAKGVDEDFGKESKYMQPIVQPPFWGIHRWIRITATCGGIAVDGNYQVIDDQKQPIPGLYAVGFGAGNLDGGIEWNKYLAGMSCGSCINSGRIAAIHAIKGTLEPTHPVTWEDVKHLYKVS